MNKKSKLLRYNSTMSENSGEIEKEILSEEASDPVAKKRKHVHFPKIVRLNVGGQIYATSLQTLTKDAGSMLHAMFSGLFDTKPSEDGSYFIDRDGTCFRYILNYLRTGKLLLPEDEHVRKEVLEEARFYQIQGIIEKLDPEPIVDELDPKPPKLYNESTILSPEQSKWLVAVHGDVLMFSQCSLLYRDSRGEWEARTFHSKCDNAGPTMVVVKSTGGSIFGGYTERSWAGNKE